MPTEMELTLEQTQQGVSYEVSNIRVISFTMKMEILLEPTSNKLMVEHAEFDESNTHVLERFYTSARNPIKEILLKLNLPDHRKLKYGSEADYRFIGTTDAEVRRRRAEEVDYGIRDVWVDPTEVVSKVAPTTLEGVNARVTELAAVQEQDTQDIYAMIEDGQDRQTQLFQKVDGVVEDGQFHYETARLLDREAHVSREAWAHSVGMSSAVHYELQAYRTHTQMQDYRIASQESLMTTLIAQNNIPLRRSFATARTAAAAAAPMTATIVEQLIAERVSAALANHETLRNSTNGHGDGSHNSGTRIRGTTRTSRECTYKDFLNYYPLNFKGTEGVVVLAQWFEKMESVFHISNYAVENPVKFATCTLIRNALTWWNSHMKAVTQDVAYAMDWKLALMYGRMFHEELEEVEKYVGGLPAMIRG
ncbi:hypothetical protein Tco_1362298, partial [Tanacetum coccineum]